ncbi:hypothetical protein [Pseudoalteromonas sp. T1lg75]|uniref:hypothetical protein n=1 Tax=Pseudoalteromonas sp. T1lg75 TaxID=2077102 RepID=UPI000CF713B7|nr:hypothetical protein [Pseudoalteromonas sp. T1lg75]
MKKISLASACAALLLSSQSIAGIYTDDLAKCLVKSTSPQDRTQLVQWMFAAASAHPAVQDISNVTGQQMETANKLTAGLFMRLLTVSCKEQTRDAIRYEGPFAIQGSFEVLGQVAGQELFASPEVTQSIAGLEKYIDSSKIDDVVNDIAN